MAAQLKAVPVGARAPRRRVKTVKQAAESGVPRDLLVALRGRIAQDIDNPNTQSRDLAALSRRLLEIAKEINAIDSQDGGDEVGRAATTPDEEWLAN